MTKQTDSAKVGICDVNMRLAPAALEAGAALIRQFDPVADSEYDLAVRLFEIWQPGMFAKSKC
jgi:hypothetical protein